MRYQTAGRNRQTLENLGLANRISRMVDQIERQNDLIPETVNDQTAGPDVMSGDT